jgi:hypothetical protein
MWRPSVFVLKAWLGGLGLGAGLTGMALAARWLVWLAAGLLAGAFLLRFVGRRTTE